MVRLGLVTYTAINMLQTKTLPTVLQSRRAYDFSVQEVVRSIRNAVSIGFAIYF